ncbi:hypothetical protein ACJIZ3_019535 [Penstemon smallii]|uniref:CAAX prenyl protease n=1 Tax=Penstemon smallii TaxID=265156 RepID=A0ABD3T2W5_9LAMI
MDPMEAILGFAIMMYMFESYLDLRQYTALKSPTLPKPLVGVISQKKFEKSRAYNIEKSRLHLVHKLVIVLMDSSLLYFGILPWFWKMSGEFLVHANINAENETFHTLAFLACLMFKILITNFAFSVYSTFVVEARHGLNKKTVRSFSWYILKETILAIVIGAPIVASIIAIVQIVGPYLPVYLWTFNFVLALVTTTPYPIISVGFNRFKHLPSCNLRGKIVTLAWALNFPVKKLLVFPRSETPRDSYAYTYGILKKKRIVLCDKLLKQCKDDEIVAVIAHELGHWKLNHTMYSFITAQILTLLQFGGCTLVMNSKDLFLSFGFDTQPVVMGFIISLYAVVPLQRLLSFLFNLVSWAFDFEADSFAKKTGYGSPLRAALIKLQELEDLSSINTDPWYDVFHYPEPSLVQRIAAMDESEWL